MYHQVWLAPIFIAQKGRVPRVGYQAHYPFVKPPFPEDQRVPEFSDLKLAGIEKHWGLTG